MTTRDICFASYTGEGMIKGKLYLPDDRKPVQLVQIIHGMAEHMERYARFCEFLASNGRAVCIHDQAGHGLSAESNEKLGYFGVQDGYLRVLDDVAETAKQALSIIGSDDLPRIIFGHSMGSFIARLYCSRYRDKINAAVFSGTRGSDPLINLGILLAGSSVKRNGPLHKDEFLAKLTGTGMLRKIKNPRTQFDWLTRDEKIVDAYMADPLCGFTFTAAGYLDLYRWIKATTGITWAEKVPEDIAVLLLSGDNDPVSGYGNGPKQVRDWLVKTGHLADLVIYPGGRHEMLNEINREEVWYMILEWLDRDPVMEDENDYNQRYS